MRGRGGSGWGGVLPTVQGGDERVYGEGGEEGALREKITILGGGEECKIRTSRKNDGKKGQIRIKSTSGLWQKQEYKVHINSAEEETMAGFRLDYQPREPPGSRRAGCQCFSTAKGGIEGRRRRVEGERERFFGTLIHIRTN